MKLFDLIFGCWHRRYSFPLRTAHDTYVVCLDCGREFEYDWQRMRITGERRKFHFCDWLEDAEKTVKAAEEKAIFTVEDGKFLKAFRIRG